MEIKDEKIKDEIKNNDYKQLSQLRLWLKIGLAQEKKGAYDSAASSYLEAVRLTEAYFDSAEEEIECPKRPEGNENTPYHLESLNDQKLFYQAHFCLAYLQEKSLVNAHANFRLVERFIKRLQNLLKKHFSEGFIQRQLDLFKKQSSYQPFIGSLTNLPLFCAECLKKTGDLFYFKGFGPANVYEEELQFLNQAIKEYYEPAIKTLLQYYFSAAQSDSILKSIIRTLFKDEDLPTKVINRLDRAQTAQVYYLLAVIMSDLGNALLSRLDKENSRLGANILATYLDKWKRLLEGEDFSSEEVMNRLFEISEENNVIKILSYYLLAARLFLRAAMHKECAFEYEKVLRTLRYCEIETGKSPIDETKEMMKLLENLILEPGQKHYRLAYLNVHRTLRETKKDDTKGDNDLSQMEPPEVESLELHWLYLMDKLTKNFEKEFEEERKKIKEYVDNISQEDYFDNIMKRIDRLTFKAHKLLDEYFRMLDLKDMNKVEIIINECLFCCYHSIVLRELHSNTFWWLHLGRAVMHRFLADWVERYNYVKYWWNKNGEQEAKRKQREIKQYMGIKNMKNIDYVYQLQQALENFHQVKETHTGGRAYKTFIQKMYYLNDDFNDRTFHFYLAQERFALRCEKVEEEIKKVKNRIDFLQAN